MTSRPELRAGDGTGGVLAAGVGQNPARQALMKAGVAKETPALTINAVCGSGRTGFTTNKYKKNNYASFPQHPI